MKTRGMGRSIMAGGIVCLILYMLLLWSAPATNNNAWGSLLFYIGVVALPLGAVLFLFGAMNREY